MINYIIWIFITTWSLTSAQTSDTVEFNTTTTNETLRSVYQEYVCETMDGYLWVADACTFPVKQGLDFFLKYGDNTQSLYDANDYTFDGQPLYTLSLGNDSFWSRTNLYVWNDIFPYSEDKICGEYMDSARECMNHYFGLCENSLSEDVASFMDTYENQFCNGAELYEYIQNQRGVFSKYISGQLRSMRCEGLAEMYDSLLAGAVCTEDVIFDSEYAMTTDNITTYVHSSAESFEDLQEEYSRTLSSALRCMEVEMRKLGCATSQSDSLVVYMYSHIVPPGVYVDLESTAAIFERPGEGDSLAIGNEAQRSRSYAGLFGNGNLLRYNRLDDFDRQLCTMRRRWSNAIVNKYITVQVLPAFERATDFGAIYFAAVEVTMYDGSGSTLIEYRTSDGDLPLDVTIVDDKTQVVSEDSDRYLSLQQHGQNTVVLTNPLGDVTLVITRYTGSSYTLYGVSLRMYDDDLERSYGTLIDGCSELDQVAILGYDPSELRNTARRSRRDVSSECRSACANLDTEYVASCEMDCTVNGGDTAQAVGVAELTEESFQEAASAEEVLLTDYDNGQTRAAPVIITTAALVLLASFLVATETHY